MLKQYILIFALSFIFYSQNLFADFVYDDRPAILENDDVLSKTSWNEMLFENDFWGNPIKNPGSHKSWRPLTTATFRIQMKIHGKNPFWFHLFNILLHSLNACLVAVLAKKLKLNEASTFCGLLFALHPINTEAVCSIVGRSDLLATCFVLLGLISEKDPLIFSILGLLSKETSIILLPLVISKQFLTNGKKEVRYVLPVLPKNTAQCNYDLTISEKLPTKQLQYLFYLSFLLYFRLSINNFESPKFSKSDNSIAYEPSIICRFLTFLYLPLFHFMLIVFPKTLCFDWQIQTIRSFSDFRIYASLLFYISILIIFKKFKSLRFLLIILCSPHIISSNIFSYVGFVAAERILYLPTVAFAIILAKIITAKGNSNRNWIIFVILSIYGSRTIDRIGEWKNETELFKSALLISPVRANANLGHIFAMNGNNIEARKHYLEALKLRPTMADVWYNLAILTSSSDRNSSIRYYHQAIKNRANFPAAHLNLGLLYSNPTTALKHLEICQNSKSEASKNYRNQQKIRAKCAYNSARINRKLQNFEKSIENLEKAIEIQPGIWELSPMIWNLLGDSWTEIGDYEKAEKYFELSMRIDPLRVNSLVNWAKIRIRQNRTNEANQLFGKALELEPNSSDVLYNIGWSSQKMGDFNRSISYYQEALKTNPNHFETLETYANLLQKLGNYSESEKYFAKIVEIHPDAASSWTNYGAILHLNRKYEKALKMYEKGLEIEPENRICQQNRRKLLRILK
ncbi:unnamed protein product [Caenorhabditis angaria]|uniref:dolichyl-phosphate-mannose--protein mannosyltransferase n=1 Tax=Caenorhabditis angaria TaxID=860376 RepID=A0A9P1N7N5_9PELO|nr:unnamed protein product [Caenorhabditis angaria]